MCVDEYIVNKTVDTNDGSCTADDCSLREAVRNANACAGWQTITIPGGAYPLTIAGAEEDAAATGDLDITDDVTIVGEGAPSIDGQGLDRIFEVFSPAVVRMETLIVLNGQAQMGAGIYNHSQLTLDGLSTQGNHAVVPPGGAGSSSGGGIFNESGVLTLVGTRFGAPRWNADGSLFAFTNMTDTRVELWVADARTARAKRIEGVSLNPILGWPFSWMPDQSPWTNPSEQRRESTCRKEKDRAPFRRPRITLSVYTPLGRAACERSVGPWLPYDLSGLDVHAATIAVAVAERHGDVRSLGVIPHTPDAVRRLVRQLGPPETLRCC